MGPNFRELYILTLDVSQPVKLFV